MPSGKIIYDDKITILSFLKICFVLKLKVEVTIKGVVDLSCDMILHTINS